MTWMEKTALEITSNQNFSRWQAVEQAIRETIEEAARRVRAEGLMSVTGSHRGTSFHQRERCAKAIESMLTDEVKS